MNGEPDEYIDLHPYDTSRLTEISSISNLTNDQELCASSRFNNRVIVPWKLLYRNRKLFKGRIYQIYLTGESENLLSVRNVKIYALHGRHACALYFTRFW